MFCHLVSCSRIDSWQLAIPRLLISDFFTGQINTLSFSVSTAKTQHPPALNKLAGRWRHWLASPFQPGGPAPPPGLYTDCVDWYRPMPALYRWNSAHIAPFHSTPQPRGDWATLVWSGHQCYNNNIPPSSTQFTDKTQHLNIHIFLPLHEDFDGFAGIKLSFR